MASFFLPCKFGIFADIVFSWYSTRLHSWTRPTFSIELCMIHQTVDESSVKIWWWQWCCCFQYQGYENWTLWNTRKCLLEFYCHSQSILTFLPRYVKSDSWLSHICLFFPQYIYIHTKIAYRHKSKCLGSLPRYTVSLIFYPSIKHTWQDEKKV